MHARRANFAAAFTLAQDSVEDLLSVADQYHAVTAIRRCEDWLLLVQIRNIGTGGLYPTDLGACKSVLRMLAAADRYNMERLRTRLSQIFQNECKQLMQEHIRKCVGTGTHLARRFCLFAKRFSGPPALLYYIIYINNHNI